MIEEGGDRLNTERVLAFGLISHFIDRLWQTKVEQRLVSCLVIQQISLRALSWFGLQVHTGTIIYGVSVTVPVLRQKTAKENSKKQCFFHPLKRSRYYYIRRNRKILLPSVCDCYDARIWLMITRCRRRPKIWRRSFPPYLANCTFREKLCRTHLIYTGTHSSGRKKKAKKDI